MMRLALRIVQAYKDAMKYRSKGYVFDEEVTAWLDALKAEHGSYNKGLRAITFQLLPASPPNLGRSPRDTPANPEEQPPCAT